MSILKFRERFRQVLYIKDSPNKISTAFALGVFLGMSPLIGIHTLLGIAFAWLFGLNRIVTLVGVYVTNPWTIIPIYTFGTWVGARLLGINHLIPPIDWAHVTFFELISKFSNVILPFLIGTTFVGTISAIVSYFVMYKAVKKAGD
jgi:uncharacterized protein (DUF2062 family)